MIFKVSKKRHRYFSFVTILLGIGVGVLALPLPSFAAQSDIVFTATLEKNEYTGEEPINLVFTLKNRGKKPVYINKRFYFGSEDAPKNQKEVYVTITVPSGAKLPYKFPYEPGYPKSDYFVLLNPDEEIKAEYPRNLRGNFEFTEPGIYTVTAVYQNTFGRELGLDVFQGKLTSGPVKFEIKK